MRTISDISRLCYNTMQLTNIIISQTQYLNSTNMAIIARTAKTFGDLFDIIMRLRVPEILL